MWGRMLKVLKFISKWRHCCAFLYVYGVCVLCKGKMGVNVNSQVHKWLNQLYQQRLDAKQLGKTVPLFPCLSLQSRTPLFWSRSAQVTSYCMWWPGCWLPACTRTKHQSQTSAYLKSVIPSLLWELLLVYAGKRKGDKTQPCGRPVFKTS